MVSTTSSSPSHNQREQTLPSVSTIQSKKRSLLASTVGNLLEWYEWSAYAVFAPFIAKAMFDSSDPVSALLSTLAVFAVGFLVRPLGGVVFGRIADRKGRKFVLITTMLMMAGGSLAIGIMPTYAAVGAWASVLLLLIRVVQGFAHGGESATANSYISELAPPNRRGLWGSIVFMAIFGGSVIAYTVGGTVTSVLSDSAVASWGWRVPFLIGAVFAIVVLYLRRNMEESEVFSHKAEDSVKVPTRGIARKIILLVAMISGITVAHYTWSSYVSTYAITQQGMNASSAFWITVVAQLIALVTLPFWGILSDRIGRRPVMIGFAITMFLIAIPLKEMITDEPWTLLVASTIALVVVAAAGSILAATMAESFPTKVRTQGIGFAYSFAVAAFGGSAPYLNALFIERGLGWVSSAYIMFLCACTFVACLIMKETKGIDLRDA
ncbi:MULTISPECIES: MFS transporter [Rhodococcus]|uniref:MFS transporter n=1 Tax=Rhodococcus globerulus TaxID=33008 RepID=UPI001C566DC7|nr:MFS transporter [Rhodococcus globerulus]QXW00474.1 MFS transporter [Rhodococcus globerulus]